ncbi:MAG: ThuA domain-containing protein [Bacteroidales bacterium]|nr:ThuA domain-containing protein [Bacteroidales bacterium]
MKKQYLSLFLAVLLITLFSSCRKDTIKTLLITGQSENSGQASSEIIRQILDETGMFSLTVIAAPGEGENMSGFKPAFPKYELIVLNYGGGAWPEEINAALTGYVNNGGGVVVCNPKSDPLSGVPDNMTKSERHDFEIRTVVTDHPVTAGLPSRWFHPGDEITHGIDASGEDVQILATALSDTAFRGSGRREPVLVARNYGNGRIFTTLLGSPDDPDNAAMHCAGFIVTLQRGAEWAATGAVTQEVPFDFPTAAGTVLRPDIKATDYETAFANIGSYDIPKSTRYFTWLQSQIRKAAGDEVALLKLEKGMVNILEDGKATVEAKKLILRELSWMGTDYSLPAIKALEGVAELKDDVRFAEERLQISN